MTKAAALRRYRSHMAKHGPCTPAPCDLTDAIRRAEQDEPSGRIRTQRAILASESFWVITPEPREP